MRVEPPRGVITRGGHDLQPTERRPTRNRVANQDKAHPTIHTQCKGMRGFLNGNSILVGRRYQHVTQATCLMEYCLTDQRFVGWSACPTLRRSLLLEFFNGAGPIIFQQPRQGPVGK